MAQRFESCKSDCICRFYSKLIKKFDKKKSKKKRPLPPLVVGALASGEITLSPLQSGLDLLTFIVPCIIQEMNEEEESYTNVGAAIEEHPSS